MYIDVFIILVNKLCRKAQFMFDTSLKACGMNLSLLIYVKLCYYVIKLCAMVNNPGVTMTMNCGGLADKEKRTDVLNYTLVQ